MTASSPPLPPPPWSHPVRLSEAQRGVSLTLEAPPEARARIAALLDLVTLHALTAQVRLEPWLDGAALKGRFEAGFTRACGLTLAPFDQTQSGEISLRIVPAGSPNAPAEAEEIDLDAPDPPDVLEGDAIDVGAYVAEHLALELDPFPRAPGAVFTPPEAPPEPSPFAALAAFKREG